MHISHWEIAIALALVLVGALYTVETFVNILPVDRCNPPLLKARFEIETTDGVRRRHAA
jgi:hypothetical protein